jgi:chromate reductase
MNPSPKILAFSGSIRKGSFNEALLNVAVAALRTAGAEVTQINLRDFPLPIYDADFEIEFGVPENAKNLRALMLQHDGFLIASPEYNGSVTGLLKNTLDWCSRPTDDVDGLAPYRGRTVALVSASLSPFGGVRGLIDLRGILAKMGAIVLAEDVAVAGANNAFAEDGALNNPGTHQALEKLAANFVKLVHTMHVLPRQAGTPQ